MEQKEFYALVAKMRDAQNHYFAAKRAKDWNERPRNQRGLFLSNLGFIG